MYITKKETRLSPLLKYPGGKEKELNYILPNIPPDAEAFYEPFVGGGAVYFSVDAASYYINDLSHELISLYRMISEQNDVFLNKLEQIQHNWEVMSDMINLHSTGLVDLYHDYRYDIINKQQLFDRVSVFVYTNAKDLNGMLQPNFNVGIENFVTELIRSFRNKIVRMKSIEAKKGDLSDDDVLLNIESAFKSAFYTHFRYLYNYIDELNLSDEFATAAYFFIREYCYSSMFRYNKKGKFNVPYGGISYNSKSMNKKITYFKDQMLVDHLNKTIIGNDDFYVFMKKYPPKNNDFIFLDPPYDTDFSTYAKNEFGKSDQKRLANYLITECDAYFMLVIKNTDFIAKLYPKGKSVKNGRVLNVMQFDKKYQVSFQDRNDKNVEHLIITNY
jgi:DNA adenine methylase